MRFPLGGLSFQDSQKPEPALIQNPVHFKSFSDNTFQFSGLASLPVQRQLRGFALQREESSLLSHPPYRQTYLVIGQRHSLARTGNRRPGYNSAPGDHLWPWRWGRDTLTGLEGLGPAPMSLPTARAGCKVETDTFTALGGHGRRDRWKALCLAHRSPLPRSQRLLGFAGATGDTGRSREEVLRN